MPPASRPPVSAKPPSPWTQPRAALIVMIVLLGIGAITGGYSRYTTPGLMVLRPLLVIAAGLFLILPPPRSRADLRAPLILIGVFAATIAIQLVPLPPSVWMALPERGRYATAALLAGSPQPWRPISIVPVLTLNALLALLPAAVVLIGFARLQRQQQALMLPAILVIAVISATWGIIQLGAGTLAYLYPGPSVGLPTGLFSNRNHQAALMAGSLPLLAAWAMAGSARRKHLSLPRVVAASAGALLVLLVLLGSGSRSGLVLAGLNAIGALFLIVAARGLARSRALLWVVPGVLGAAALATLIAFWSGRGSGFARFLALREPGAEMRFSAWPILKRLMVDYLPWGSGFGTFDPLFRIYEPDSLLKPSYFNAAHSDPVELVITGGIPAAIVALVFVVWYVRRTIALFAMPVGDSVLAARAGAMLLLTLLLASLSDYPLRTPLAGMIAALAIGLMVRADRALLVQDTAGG